MFCMSSHPRCEAGRVRGTLLVDSRHNFWNFPVDSLLRVDTTFFFFIIVLASQPGAEEEFLIWR